MTLLLKAKRSAACLPLQDLFCSGITSLRNIETGSKESLGVLLLIWLPGSTVSALKDKWRHYSHCHGCFSNTRANEGLWLKASHLLIVVLALHVPSGDVCHLPSWTLRLFQFPYKPTKTRHPTHNIYHLSPPTYSFFLQIKQLQKIVSRVENT